MALPALLSDRSAVAVEVTLRHQASASDISFFRITNTPGLKRVPFLSSALRPPFDSANYEFFDDRITGTIQITSRISIDQIGSQAQSGVEAIGGSIDFAIGMPPGAIPADDYITAFLQLLWKGSAITIWQGPTGSTDLAEYTLILNGIVDDFSYTTSIATIKLGGNLRRVDGPINTDLYIPGSGVPSAVIGKARPTAYGHVKHIEPILYNEGAQEYEIMFGAPLGAGFVLGLVENVTVGGIVWHDWGVPVDINTPTGYYYVNYAIQRMYLSGAPGALDLRIDAKVNGWEFTTPALLIKNWLIAKNINYDLASFIQLDIDRPQAIGYATGLEPVNMLDAIDDVLGGSGCYLSENSEGKISVHAIKSPTPVSDDPTYDLEGMNADGIIDFRLIRIPSRAYQIRVEYERVWSPASNFAETADEATIAVLKGPGLISVGFGPNTFVRDSDKSSVDPPVTRTVVATRTPADEIAIQLGEAWVPERRVYEVTLRTEPPKINTTIYVNYRGVVKYMRVISVIKNLGIGTAVIQIWG